MCAAAGESGRSSFQIPPAVSSLPCRRAGGKNAPIPHQLRKEGGCAEPGPQQHLSPQVPDNKNVKVRFKAFFLQEPNVPVGSCTKDYVEINGEK